MNINRRYDFEPVLDSKYGPGFAKGRSFINYMTVIGKWLEENNPILNEKITYLRENKQVDIKNFENIQKLCDIQIIEQGSMFNTEAKFCIDFANQYIGGGALSGGCVQEEILFAVEPEAIVSMFLMEVMDDNDAIRIDNLIQYSNYSGYAFSFKYEESAIKDEQNLIRHNIIAIDAVELFNSGGVDQDSVMRDLIKAYVEHQTNILLAATNYDKDKAEKRKHILEGLLLIIVNIDKAIALIRSSLNTTEAKDKLIKEFSIDEIQAKAVLDMKLAKLTKLDKDDLVKELEEKKVIIAECEKIINDQNYRNLKLIEKITALKDKYGDERKTELLNIEIPKEEKEIAEVIPEDVVVVMTQSGLIKKVPKTSFKVQRKGGKGVKSEDDIILDVIRTNTVDTLMFFSSKGKMYRTIVDNLPTGTNVTKGVPVSSLIKLKPNEKIMAITSLHRKTTPQFIIFITKNGIVKKSYLEEYMKTNRNTGIAALNVKEGDSVVKILFQDEEDLLLVTKNGMSIRFATKEMGAIGRVAAGVKGIKLGEGDEVVAAMSVHKETDQVGVFTSLGIGKKVALKEFPSQGRGGKGTIVYKCTDSTGTVIGAEMLSDEDNLLLCGSRTSICISAKDVPVIGKTGIGNIMTKGGQVLSVTKI